MTRPRIRPAVWITALFAVAVLASSCHREACPGQISQADEPVEMPG